MKNKISITLRPFKYLFFSEKTNSILLLAFLLPQVLMLAITKSWSSLLVVFSTTLASVFVEVIFKINRKKNAYSYLTVIIQGILAGIFLPAQFPFYTAFAATFLVGLCCRFLIGAHSDCWINIPALTVCICWIICAGFFPSYQITREILLARNPALELIQNGTFPMVSLDTRITTTLNKTIFSLFGVSIPDGYVSLFWDTHSQIPAFRFNFITLVTSIILISLDVIKAMIPGIFILVYGLLVYFVSPVLYGALPGQGDLLLALCTSGILVSTLFLLQTAGTTPITNAGKAVYGLIAGILAFLIIGAGTSPAGAVFTIVLINLISPVIQQIEHFVEMKKVKNNLLERVKELKDGTNA